MGRLELVRCCSYFAVFLMLVVFCGLIEFLPCSSGAEQKFAAMKFIAACKWMLDSMDRVRDYTLSPFSLMFCTSNLIVTISSSQERRGMVAIWAKGPQMTEALSAGLKKQLPHQTSKADKLFTEVGEMKVGMAEKDKEISSLRSALKKDKKNWEALENVMAARQDSFNQEAQLAYSVISSALLEVGAESSGIGHDDQQILARSSLTG